MEFKNLKNSSHICIIAEAGSNWKIGTYEEDIEQSKKLIKTAKKSGADIIKFQTFKPETVYVKNAGKSDYLKKTGFDLDIYDTFQDLSMPHEMIKELSVICKNEEIEFMSTPFSVKDAEIVNQFVNIHKVASYEINHIQILEYLSQQQKPIIISTGANSYEEIDFTVKFFQERGLDEIAILQCTAAYPAPIDALNLSTITEMQKRYNLPIGLSDHSLDPIIAPTTAISLGATIIEKHFTLDKNLPGPDHKFALEPEELTTMIRYIRLAEKIRGDGIKIIQPIEQELRNFAVRSVQAIKDIEEGEVLEEDINFAILRPGIQKRGAEPRFFNDMIAKKTRRKIKSGEGILLEDLI